MSQKPPKKEHAKLEAKKKPARSTKGSSGSSRWLYAVLVLIGGGLVWVLWPLFSPPETKHSDAAKELREMTQNPDAEVLNPPGDALKKK